MNKTVHRLDGFRAVVRGALAVMIFAAVLLITGCLEREETVEVKADGACTISVNVKANSKDEFAPGHAPTEAGGWKTTIEEVRDDGKAVRQLLRATQTFAAGAKLPDRDGDPADRGREEFVQFPTTVKIEKRADGTYYHFRRMYLARAQAEMWAIDQRPGAAEISELMKKGEKEITAAELVRIVKWTAETNTLKALATARRPYLAVVPDAPQDRWLAIRAGTLAVVEKIDAKRLTELLSMPDGPEREQALTKEAPKFNSDVETSLREAIAKHAGFTADESKRFEALLDAARVRQQITEGVGKHAYRVIVSLPGELVGTNTEKRDGDRLLWEFNGDVMHDRDFELLATSRVPAK